MLSLLIRPIKPTSTSFDNSSRYFLRTFAAFVYNRLKEKGRIRDRRGLLGVIGPIDGSEIRIEAPREREHELVNCKGYHSIKLHAIALPNCAYSSKVNFTPI